MDIKQNIFNKNLILYRKRQKYKMAAVYLKKSVYVDKKRKKHILKKYQHILKPLSKALTATLKMI